MQGRRAKICNQVEKSGKWTTMKTAFRLGTWNWLASSITQVKEHPTLRHGFHATQISQSGQAASSFIPYCLIHIHVNSTRRETQDARLRRSLCFIWYLKHTAFVFPWQLRANPVDRSEKDSCLKPHWAYISFAVQWRAARTDAAS